MSACRAMDRAIRREKSKTNFAAWLLEDVNAIYAERNTPRDEQLMEYVAQGWLSVAEETPKDRTFIFTNQTFRTFTEFN